MIGPVEYNYCRIVLSELFDKKIMNIRFPCRKKIETYQLKKIDQKLYTSQIIYILQYGNNKNILKTSPFSKTLYILTISKSKKFFLALKMTMMPKIFRKQRPEVLFGNTSSIKNFAEAFRCHFHTKVYSRMTSSGDLYHVGPSKLIYETNRWTGPCVMRFLPESYSEQTMILYLGGSG